jgi:hypothetical protein
MLSLSRDARAFTRVLFLRFENCAAFSKMGEKKKSQKKSETYAMCLRP